MINIHGRNHPGGHGHPLLSSTTPDRRIMTPVFLRGVESECLPLPSILRQQYIRASFLAEFLTCHRFKENPTSNG